MLLKNIHHYRVHSLANMLKFDSKSSYRSINLLRLYQILLLSFRVIHFFPNSFIEQHAVFVLQMQHAV